MTERVAFERLCARLDAHLRASCCTGIAVRSWSVAVEHRRWFSPRLVGQRRYIAARRTSTRLDHCVCAGAMTLSVTYWKANNFASGIFLPMIAAVMICVASIENVMPLPPYPMTA